MPKSGIKISMIHILRVIVAIALAIVLFSGYQHVTHFIFTDRMFAVKDIYLDVSIQFIDQRSLMALKGKNIFAVNIDEIERKYLRQYPQIAKIRVVRELPDRIKILARKRDMLAQVSVHGKYLLLDGAGNAVVFVPKPIPLPLIEGWRGQVPRTMGRMNDHVIVNMLALIKKYQSSPILNSLPIDRMDVSNSAKIIMSLRQVTGKIILDVENGVEKLDVLIALLQQKKLDLKQVGYIDIRFEQPVIAGFDDAIVQEKRGP